MKVVNSETMRLQFLVGQRVLSLLDDGFKVLFDVPNLNGVYFVKLQHVSNGNVVTITADCRKNYMVQRSNGRIVYTGSIQA